jgi:hypothetical protein
MSDDADGDMGERDNASRCGAIAFPTREART